MGLIFGLFCIAYVSPLFQEPNYFAAGQELNMS